MEEQSGFQKTSPRTNNGPLPIDTTVDLGILDPTQLIRRGASLRHEASLRHDSLNLVPDPEHILAHLGDERDHHELHLHNHPAYAYPLVTCSCRRIKISLLLFCPVRYVLLTTFFSCTIRMKRNQSGEQNGQQE